MRVYVCVYYFSLAQGYFVIFFLGGTPGVCPCINQEDAAAAVRIWQQQGHKFSTSDSMFLNAVLKRK